VAVDVDAAYGGFHSLRTDGRLQLG
jgi:hypothetical protein